MSWAAGFWAWSLRMASRAWASAEAVTVQVLRTTMVAFEGSDAGVQPRSRSWRSRAAPSAWVARQPNCWMKKVDMGFGQWRKIIKEKDFCPEFTENAEGAVKKRERVMRAR